jgi:hypothetical protein
MIRFFFMAYLGVLIIRGSFRLYSLKNWVVDYLYDS